jgi:hypothetical protein
VLRIGHKRGRWLLDPPEVPEVQFDEYMAVPIFPRPVVKHAVLVRIPITDDGAEIPTFIKPEWGTVQVFYGDYYAIIGNDGSVIYGSARIQWEQMHSLTSPGYWVKTAVPLAYQVSESCRIVTLIPSDDGGIREASVNLQPGDWIVRQPGGEVQHIKEAVFETLYFSQEEAEQLGLTAMTAEQFAEWAVARASTKASRSRP